MSCAQENEKNHPRILGPAVPFSHSERYSLGDANRGPQKSQRFSRQEKAMLHCDLRVRWKVASDLRFRAAISNPKTSSFCGISGNFGPSTRKSRAIAIMRFWCAKATVKRGAHSCKNPLQLKSQRFESLRLQRRFLPSFLQI